MKNLLLWRLVYIAWFAIASAATADSITLNSGEVVEGRITSETDKQIQLEVSQYGGTILATRSIAKADVKNVNRESPEAKKEKATYEILTGWKLNPNQELTEQQY